MLNKSNTKNLTAKQYRTITAFVAAIIGFSVSLANLTGIYISMLVITIGMAVLLYAKSRVKDVLEDERDKTVGGEAARLAIGAYSTISIVVMFVLYPFRLQNPFFETIVLTLSFSACALMGIYSLAFYLRNKGVKPKTFFWALIAVSLIVFLTGVRLLSGEDSWICKDGEWTEHGKPSSPKPVIKCTNGK